jgi:tRNA dimethylallyltransferase
MTAQVEPLNILTGCTAAGKTQLALEWADANRAEIVSCDSLLFYRGMDIGTAKPAPGDLARVPHHLIDIADVTERMDVRLFITHAQSAIAEIEKRGRRILIVGGSGFYLKSFFAPVADELESDPTLKDELEKDLLDKGLSALVERLSQLNPEGLGGLDTRNPRRVVRALERCLVSGLPLVELTRQFAEQSSPFADRKINLVEITREPEDLRERILMRAAQMLSAGLIDEVRSLRKKGLEKNPSAARAIGYREVLSFLDRGGSEQDLVDEIAKNTWRLVRKQRTWFRTQLPAHHCIAAQSAEQASVGRLFP